MTEGQTGSERCSGPVLAEGYIFGVGHTGRGIMHARSLRQLLAIALIAGCVRKSTHRPPTRE